MVGQANHFRRYAKDQIPYAIERYTNEANRLTNVLDKRLAESPYVACEEYTIADIAIFQWLRGAGQRGVILAEYPNVKRWFDEIGARPAVQRGVQVLAQEQSSAPHDPKAWDIMFGKTLVSASMSTGVATRQITRLRDAISFVWLSSGCQVEFHVSELE